MILGILRGLSEITHHQNLETKAFKSLCVMINKFVSMSKEKQQLTLDKLDSKKLEAGLTIIEKFFEKHYVNADNDIVRKIETIKSLIENAKASLVFTADSSKTNTLSYKQNKLTRTATFYFMHHENQKRLAGVQSNGHLAVLLEERNPAEKTYRYKYISFYPKKSENTAKNSGSKRHVRVFSNREAKLEQYEKERFTNHFLNALKVSFDCNEKHPLNFEKMWAMCDTIEQAIDQDTFNILTHNCTNIALDIFHAGQENNEDYPKYKDGLKNLREQIAKTPVNAWRHITLHNALMVANYETDRQKLNELKQTEMIADHTPAKKLFERLKLTKVALIKFMSCLENIQANSSLQLQTILTKIDYFYDKLFNDTSQLNKIIAEMSDYISNLALEIDQSENDKLYEVVILLKNNLENLGTIRNLELHWLDAVFAANALYMNNTEDAQSRKNIKTLINAKPYATVDLKEEEHNQPNFSYVQDSIVLTKKLIYDLKQIESNPLPNLAKGLDQIWKTIHTIQGLRKKFIFENKNKSLTELEPTLKFFGKIEDSLQTLAQPINNNLYFEINKEKADSPLSKLNLYINNEDAIKNKDKPIHELLIDHDKKLNYKINNLITRLPSFVSSQIKMNDQIKPLQNIAIITSMVNQQPSLIEFWKKGWFEWNFTNMFKKNKLKKDIEILLLDAKVNSAITNFVAGKLSPPEFIIDAEWFMNKKSQLQGRPETRHLKNFLTSVKQLYTTHMFNANSTLADRAKSFGSDLVILDTLGSYSHKFNKAKEIQVNIIERSVVKNQPNERPVDTHNKEVETELELHRHMRSRPGFIPR